MARKPRALISCNGVDIGETDKMVPLLRLWVASGSPDGKEPWRWLDTEQARGFIDFIAEFLNLAKTEVLKTKRGRYGGGTWAHWQVAMAYAKYLSHEFHVLVNSTFAAAVEERKRLLQVRPTSIDTRKVYCSKIKEKNASHKICTSRGYRGAWLLDAVGLRKKHGLPEDANLREYMSSQGLAICILYESMAIERIDATGAQGTEACASATEKCASFVRKAILDERKSRGPTLIGGV